MKTSIKLAAILVGQGFGTRKECVRMIRAGLVEVGTLERGEIRWRKGEAPDELITLSDLHLRISGIAVPYREQLHIAFNKPTDTECSHSSSHHKSVFAFFPEPFLKRGLEIVGRLDADTTGLLLLSDSGQFNHFLTSPRRHVPKTYRVGTKHPITQEQKARLESGVELRNEDCVTLPAKVVVLGDRVCDMTIEEGKYHQVKRMFAAVGNRVECIHRIAIGSLRLDETLGVGEWRILDAQDLAALGFPKGI